MGFLRKKGLRLIIYLDDILILNASRERVLADLEVVIELLQRLGFIINWEKSVLEPSQNLEYLGLVIDSNRLSFALPKAKIEAVKAMCEAALLAKVVSLREIASIMGNFTWAIPAIPYAQAHYRRLQSFYIRKSKAANSNLKIKCLLSLEAKDDLKWWVANLDKAKDKVFFPHRISIYLLTLPYRVGELAVMRLGQGGHGRLRTQQDISTSLSFWAHYSRYRRLQSARKT
jgi:hypothetical protein